MEDFEKAYKRWLLAGAKKETNQTELTASLNHFLDILSKIRTVYPKGTLHSCDDEDTFEGSIILNHSALGII